MSKTSIKARCRLEVEVREPITGTGWANIIYWVQAVSAEIAIKEHRFKMLHHGYLTRIGQTNLEIVLTVLEM